jgi:hypothetical protein
MLVPVFIYTLITKKVPKLKVIDFDGNYTDKVPFSDSLYLDITNEDMKHIRGRLRDSIFISVFSVCIDILTFIGLAKISKNEAVEKIYLAAMILIVVLVTGICLFLSYRKSKVFKNQDSFKKTVGYILKYKKKMVYRTGFKGIYVYKVLVAIPDAEKKSLVVKDTLPEFIFESAQKKNYTCTVILYKGKAATIIK